MGNVTARDSSDRTVHVIGRDVTCVNIILQDAFPSFMNSSDKSWLYHTASYKSFMHFLHLR